MELNKVETSKLIEELTKREDVKGCVIKSHVGFKIESSDYETYLKDFGPAIVIVVKINE